MSYLVFARKWRPQVFEDVVGQGHVTTTLKNAILSNRVAHAYLFSGPRGVGKTTTARIFAKALNCQSSDKPVPVPCNKCESCIEIRDGRSLDVIEIDGASNRGIDEIRQLRENAKFGPSKGRYKVYIIDEVHQITQDGFNALLKTLEEPPPHVKFVFATTHRHKVIPTILSRCQRFDFKRVAIASLVDKLKSIAASEKLDIDEDTLFVIARSADGSVRDAESILDQVASFSKQKIHKEDIVSLLGTIEQEVFFEITECIIDKNASSILQLINRSINDGHDPLQFVNGLLGHFRDLAIAKVQPALARYDGRPGRNLAALIDLPRDQIDKIIRQAQDIELTEILYVFNMLSNAQDAMRKSGFARLQLEMAMIKLTKPAIASQIKDVIKDAPQKNAFADNSVSVAVAIEEKPGPKAASDEGFITIDEVNNAWPAVLQAVKSEKISAALFLMEGRPDKIDGAALIINFPAKFIFYKEALERIENRSIIEKYLWQATAKNIKVKFAVVDDLATPLVTRAPSEGAGQDTAIVTKAPSSEGAKQAEPIIAKAVSSETPEPIIESALDIFRARVIRKD